MKKSDVPQQAHSIYEGETKLVYAVNEKGKLETAQTAGWDAEIDVLSQAIEEIHRLADAALLRVHQGQSSPLEYHMYAQRMDIAMLAQAAGKFRWKVKRHLQPKHFKKLSNKQLEIYASILGIDVDQLQTVPEQ